MKKFLFILLILFINKETYSETMNDINKIYNYYKINKYIGTAGQPKSDEFQFIKDNGYSVVINLATYESDNAIPKEEEIVTGLGMTYVHIPVPWNSPDKTHLIEFVEQMNSYNSQKIFIHCMANYRVSAFIYQYLTQIKGLSKSQSTSPIMSQWLPNMDQNWKSFININLN